MPCTDGRTNPHLWERAKKKALSEACRSGTRRWGKWDARIAFSVNFDAAYFKNVYLAGL